MRAHVSSTRQSGPTGSKSKVVWANVYFAGAAGSAITQIKQTIDGGFISVGNATDLAQDTGALILKLDAHGNVQWQRQLGPGASTMACLEAVLQTSDGGFRGRWRACRPSLGSNAAQCLCGQVRFEWQPLVAKRVQYRQ
jgi:hypothetical protein